MKKLKLKIQMALAVIAAGIAAAFRQPDAIALGNNKPAAAQASASPAPAAPGSLAEDAKALQQATEDTAAPLRQQQQQPNRGAEAELARVNGREAEIVKRLKQSNGLLTREQAVAAVDNQVKFAKKHQEVFAKKHQEVFAKK